MPETYAVVILVEECLTSDDAARIHSLHEALEDDEGSVTYHVLLPLDDARARMQAAMGGISPTPDLGVGAAVLPEIDTEQIVQEVRARSEEWLASTLASLNSTGAHAVGELVTTDPIDALAEKVSAVDAREAIIVTHPHVVAEFFHVDWTSRARRRIGVPVLHLLEHESFDEQAGGGEGVTGL